MTGICNKKKKNAQCVQLDRYDRLQECATECLQKLGQSVLAAYFHHLILLFKGYVSFLLEDDSILFCFIFYNE
jgi:hypothetical protein